MKTIDELWYGNISPFEQCTRGDKRLKELLPLITRNGDGSVFHRHDGRWESRLVVGYKENGYAKTKSVTAKTKAECEKKLAELIKTMKAEIAEMKKQAKNA